MQPTYGLCPPPNDATRYCPNSRPGAIFASTTPTCYVLNSAATGYTAHQAACQALGELPLPLWLAEYALAADT